MSLLSERGEETICSASFSRVGAVALKLSHLETPLQMEGIEIQGHHQMDSIKLKMTP
jgi:hypothetical protein